MINKTHKIAVLTSLFLLSACGGGGSSPTPAPAGPPPNKSPVVSLQATANGLLVNATADGSNDPDGTIVSYAWDFGEPASGSNSNTASGPAATHVYRNAGSFTLTLQLTDNGGAIATRSMQLTLTVPAANPTGRLNDTGVSSAQCIGTGNTSRFVDCSLPTTLALTTTPDGLTGRDASGATNSGADGKLGFSFTKFGAAGEQLAAAATAWSCVRDDVTGLMWENKAADGGPRDFDKTYTNFSTAYDPNQALGTSTDASGYVLAVNIAGLCGAHDWRLPTAQELLSLVDYGAVQKQPQIDVTYFSRTGLDSYWSATTYVHSIAFRGDKAWLVQMELGVLVKLTRQTAQKVRLVRGQPVTGARWTVSPDGQEITDNRTLLIWRRCPEGLVWDPSNGGTCTGTHAKFPTRFDAQTRATIQATTTAKGWRIPNVKELLSIVDATVSNPAINVVAFPKTQSSNDYWTSTPAPPADPDGWDEPSLWKVDFGAGHASPFWTYGTESGLRLVRDPR